MANLEFVAQHNMVACLEKTKENSEFHEIVDFLTSNTIHHALIQIHATVDSNAVVVTEAFIKSSLLFNDVDDGTNRSEGEQIQSPHDSPLLGGHTSDRAEGALNLEELFSFYTNLSNKVLALETVKDAQAAEIIALKARIKKLEKKRKPNISHHRAWLKCVQRLSMKKRFGKKEFVSKQGRKKDRPEPTLNDSTLDDLDADHGMYTEEAMNQGRLSEETKELVSTARPEGSTVRTYVGTADPIAPPPPTTTTTIFDDEDITMDQTLIKMKEEKAKEKRDDKGKGVLEEPEPAKKMTRSDLDAAQIAKDSKVARLVHEEEWIYKSWNFYENCRVHTLTLKDGIEIYMLAERRYPLIKETLERMMDLRLIAKCESEAVFDLLRFIQKQIDESGSRDRSEKDLQVLVL
uniref:Uncharacterized protein n=1 Tax=Tanacetum cinerariifolium TaxID=118510 RepID=A0A6L2N7K5_TANCI|nr:hypothetical protein [Tanacetum cinerariifolium]